MNHYADHLEKKIGDAFDSRGIVFTHESNVKKQGTDFYLPAYDVHIEVKQFYAERVIKQIADKPNVILLQGKDAVDVFCKLIIKKES
jgi:hypothetical protein